MDSLGGEEDNFRLGKIFNYLLEILDVKYWFK